MNKSHAKAFVSEGGRLSLPASMRRELGLEKGGPVSLTLDDDGIHIETTQQFVKRIQKMARDDGWHKAISVDDFIRDKRAEAAAEYAKLDRSL